MSLLLPAISLTPDPAWVKDIPFLRQLADARDMAGCEIRTELDDNIARFEREGKRIGHDWSFCWWKMVAQPYAACAADASPYSAARSA